MATIIEHNSTQSVISLFPTLFIISLFLGLIEFIENYELPTMKQTFSESNVRTQFIIMTLHYEMHVFLPLSLVFPQHYRRKRIIIRMELKSHVATNIKVLTYWINY